MANIDGLTPAQNRAIAALLEARDIRSAAAAAKVSERTLGRWLVQPDFQRALRAAERRAIDVAVRRLSQLSGEAVATLKTVMADSEVAPGTRVQAAAVALAKLIDLRAAADLEERLAVVEAKLEGTYEHKAETTAG